MTGAATVERPTSARNPRRVRLDLDLNPVPQGRPIVVFHRKGGAHGRTPDRTEQFYRDFKLAVRQAQGRGPRKPLERDVRLLVRLWRQCRNSTDRGDISNMLKAIEDAGNELLWLDDDQIVGIDCELVASGPGVKGRIIIVATELREQVKVVEAPRPRRAKRRPRP